MTVRIRTRYVVAASAICGIGLLVATHAKILPFGLTWLDVGQPPQQADAIFVLLGGADIRPFAAAALYRAGFAPEILLGVARPITPNKYSPPMHVIYHDILRKRGVPDSAIRFLGDGVHNTMKESDALRDYLREHPQSKVLVLTTHFHTRRTRWSLRRSLGPMADQLHFVSCAHDDFDETNWWLFPGGFELVLMEYIKLAGYWVFYGNAIWYAVAVGLTMLAWIAWRWKKKPIEAATISESEHAA